jgi:hypothetical protein
MIAIADPAVRAQLADAAARDGHVTTPARGTSA